MLEKKMYAMITIKCNLGLKINIYGLYIMLLVTNILWEQKNIKRIFKNHIRKPYSNGYIWIQGQGKLMIIIITIIVLNSFIYQDDKGTWHIKWWDLEFFIWWKLWKLELKYLS